MAAGVTEIELGECTCGRLLYDAKMRVQDPQTGEPTGKSQIVEKAALPAVYLAVTSPKGPRHISVCQVNTLKFPEVPAGTYLATWIRDECGSARRPGHWVGGSVASGGHREVDPSDPAVEGNSDGQLSLGFFSADGTHLPKKFSLGKEAFIGPDNLVF